MTVESIGNIADAYSNGKLPQRGMIISATKITSKQALKQTKQEEN